MSEEEAIEFLKSTLITGREGFFCLKSNKNLTLKKALKICRKKDSIEKIFDSLKNGIQIKPLRVWSEDSIYGALILGFIAQLFISLMRSEFEEVKHRSTKFIKKRYPLQIKWVFNHRKNIIVIPFTLIISWSHKMELEALKQFLASLDINPDEIEDKRYATAFRILFSIVEKQNEEMEFLKAENQKFRDEINLLKGEQTKPKIRGSKKNEDISSEKERHKRRCL